MVHTSQADFIVLQLFVPLNLQVEGQCAAPTPSLHTGVEHAAHASTSQAGAALAGHANDAQLRCSNAAEVRRRRADVVAPVICRYIAALNACAVHAALES